MTDATPGEDPFAWLRSGSRRVGETAVWGRAVGVWGQTDGDALRPGTDFSLGGAIAGVDHVFAPQLLAGAAVQWTTTDVDFDLSTGDASVDSLEVGAYASYGDARLFMNANVSYIWHDFEVNRVTGLNHARGGYNGDTFSAYVEGGKSFQTDEGLRIQPTIALSYSHLETDPYTETGTGTLLNVSDASLDALKSIIGARFAYSFTTGGGRSLVPEARILWSHEFMDDHSSHFVDPVGGGVTWTLVDGEKFSRDTLVLGTGLTASLSASTTLFLDYDAGLNSDITTHTVSAGLRTRW
jgi:subtilase-type serine protease